MKKFLALACVCALGILVLSQTTADAAPKFGFGPFVHYAPKPAYHHHHHHHLPWRIKMYAYWPTDLAAVNIVRRHAVDPMTGTSKRITMGVVRNVGGVTAAPGRTATLYRRTPGGWTPIASRVLPATLPGTTLYVSFGYVSPSAGQLMLLLSPGDGYPANDVFYL